MKGVGKGNLNDWKICAAERECEWEERSRGNKNEPHSELHILWRVLNTHTLIHSHMKIVWKKLTNFDCKKWTFKFQTWPQKFSDILKYYNL